MIEWSDELFRMEMMEKRVCNADNVERWMEMSVADNMSLQTMPFDRYDTRMEKRSADNMSLETMPFDRYDTRKENRMEMEDKLVRRENRVERSEEHKRSDDRREMMEKRVRNADNDRKWMEWRRMTRDRGPPPLQSPGEVQSNTMSLQYRPDLSKPRYNSLPYPPR